MDEEAGFIAALLADPDEQTVLLAYADWLDERDDLRGKYLRLLAKGLVKNGEIGEIDLRWFIQLTSQIDHRWRCLIETRHWRVGDLVRPHSRGPFPADARVAAISPDRSVAEVVFSVASGAVRRVEMSLSEL